MQDAFLPIFLFIGCTIAVAVGLLLVSSLFNPGRPGRVTRMPYESGMDPIHDTRRRFDVRFHLLAIAFLVFDVELLFLYPWAVASRPVAVASEGARPREQGAEEVGGRRSAAGQGAEIPYPKVQIPDPESQISNLKSEVPGPRSPSPLPSPLSPLPSPPTASRHLMFAGAMTFLALLALGYVYDWRKGIFRWR